MRPRASPKCPNIRSYYFLSCCSYKHLVSFTVWEYLLQSRSQAVCLICRCREIRFCKWGNLRVTYPKKGEMKKTAVSVCWGHILDVPGICLHYRKSHEVYEVSLTHGLTKVTETHVDVLWCSDPPDLTWGIRSERPHWLVCHHLSMVSLVKTFTFTEKHLYQMINIINIKDKWLRLSLEAARLGESCLIHWLLRPRHFRTSFNIYIFLCHQNVADSTKAG